MKSINLHFEEFGPWMKFHTPLITPNRKVMPISVHPGIHKRTSTTTYQQKDGDSDLLSLNPEHSNHYNKDEDDISPRLPLIDFIGKSHQKESQKRTSQDFFNTVKDYTIDDLLPNPETEWESTHINHQYFPYRLSGNMQIIQSLKPGNPKNVFTYKLKKFKQHSCTPVVRKNYFFWNQRKLVASRISRSPKPSLK